MRLDVIAVDIFTARREIEYFTEMVMRFNGVPDKLQSILENRGYKFVELGYGKKCYTSLGAVGYMHIMRDNTRYFGVGFSPIERGGKEIYRAFIKAIR